MLKIKTEDKRELILHGNLRKTILVIAIPIMLNNIIQSIYNITDTYFVSKLGSTEMAAMTLVFPIVFFFLGIGMGMSVAGTSLISQYIGDDNKKAARRVAGEIITLAVLSSILIAIIGSVLTPVIIKTMGGKGELLTLAVSYLRIIFYGMPALFLFFAFTAIKQGQGNTLTPMKYTALSVGLNIILDPVFIFSFNLGIAGAAMATIIARSLFTFYAIFTLFSKHNGIHINLKDLFLDKRVIKLIKVGIPSSIGQSMAAFGFIFLNIFIISYGENTLAAFGIGNRITSLIIMPAMGLGKTLNTIVGQNLGYGQIERAKNAVKKSAAMTTIFLITGGIILFPLSPYIINIFTDNPSVSSQGLIFLRLIIISLPLMGFFQIFIGTFQGSGHTIYAMILMMGRLWALRLPMIILFKNFTNWGSKGVWYAMVLSNAISCLVGFIIYLSGKWQKSVIEQDFNDKLLINEEIINEKNNYST